MHPRTFCRWSIPCAAPASILFLLLHPTCLEIQSTVQNPFAGRFLRNWFKDAGLENVQTSVVGCWTDDLRVSDVDSVMTVMIRDGLVDASRGIRWLQQLRALVDKGNFFYSLSLFVVSGTKPKPTLET